MRRTVLCLMVILVFSAASITMSQSPLYRRLYYNSVDLDDGPHFICQECGYHFLEPYYRQIRLYLIRDFNGLVTFKCPVCGAEYQLYVALHRYDDGRIGVRIQRSDGIGGIPADWWNITGT